MALNSRFLALSLAAVGFGSCFLPAAFAQEYSQRQASRLVRPGELPASNGRPGAGRPFSLGARHETMAEPEDQTPLRGMNAQQDDSAGRSDRPFSLGSQKAGEMFPNVDVPIRSSERDIPNMSVPTTSMQLLSKYDVELVVDKSMSMMSMDCPNFMSRWDWCGSQATDLAQKMAPFVPQSLTITTFAKHYDVYPNSSAQDIAHVFDHHSIGAGTRLAEPLQDRLGAYFSNRHPGSKPLLIAVITDGQPHPDYEPPAVIDAISQATHNVRDPHEITVVFFQIGGADHKGRAFLNELDNNMMRYGAKYDIVQTVPFERLQQIGLAQALVDSIKDFAHIAQQAPTGGTPPGRKNRFGH